MSPVRVTQLNRKTRLPNGVLSFCGSPNASEETAR